MRRVVPWWLGMVTVLSLTACEADPVRVPDTSPLDAETLIDMRPPGDAAWPRDGAMDRGVPPDAELPPAEQVAARARLFGAEEVVPIHIELDDQAFETLRDNPRDYVQGAITVDGVQLSPVGIRLKGGASYKPITSKAAWKVDIDRYDASLALYGLRKLTLNNMVQDHTKVRERLASTSFRRFGVPAPRVGYAEVTVNDTEYGLYTHIEVPDETFLERTFPRDGGGVLYEGEYDYDLWMRDLDVFDEDAGSDEQRAGLARVIAGLDRALPITFDLDVGSVVDLVAMRRFFAAEMVVGHWDGYANQRNNFFVYIRPSDGRLIFLPWGTDQTFTRIRDAFSGRGRLFRMCVDWLPCRLPYAETVEELVRRQEAHDFAGEIEALRAVIDPVHERDPKSPTSAERRAEALTDLVTWIEDHPQRMRSTLRCLDPAADLDGDLTLGCAGDCAEDDATRYPGAVDSCDDGVDQDCSGVTDDGQVCPECRPLDGPDGARFLLCHREASYSQPDDICARHGGWVASLRDDAEHRRVAEAALGRKDASWWIGLRLEDGQFRWTDGHPLDFVAWADGQPDGSGGCVAIGSSTSAWHQVHCGLRRPVVCRLPSEVP